MATTNYPPPTPPHHFQQVQQVQQIQQFPQVQPASQYQNQTQTQPQYRTQFQTQAKPASQPPITQVRPQPQSRKSRSFSFRSDKSHGSNNNKPDLTETHLEKEAKRLHTKADPTLAMNEQEPAEVAATGKSSLASLRAMQHKDAFGNPIAEPDRSNPTRSRWERPLDTIRSFEAAIDGNYSNRKSFIRPDSESAYNSRRTSYYGNNGAPGRFSHDSYYSNRPPSMMYANRQDGSQHDLRQPSMGQRDNYYDQQQGYNGYAQNGGQRRVPRTNPDYPGYRHQNPNEYSIPSNHRSYETVASASGSGSSAEPAGYQTDPTSSDNSSVDRMHAVPRRQPEPINDYGIGFTQEPELQAPTFTVGVKSSPLANGGGAGDAAMTGYPQNNGALNYGNSVPPAPPQKDKILRKPTNAQYTQQPPQRPAAPEKRKSWFARRFSKQA